MREISAKLFKENSISLPERALEKLLLYKEILEEENSKYNLTSITTEKDIAEKLFLDSALLVGHIEGGKLLDIGSGAGFPGLVLAILMDNLKVTLVESIQKKANFLSIVIKKLELTNCEVINSRVEDLELFNSFDYATARAVASLPVIIEYAMPFLKVGGSLLAQKGPKYREEIELCNFEALGTKLVSIEENRVGDGIGYILKIEKTEDKIKKIRRNLKKSIRDRR